MSILTIIMVFLIGVSVGNFVGNLNAHVTVATECEKLGGFYVGSKVFKCEMVEDKDDR